MSNQKEQKKIFHPLVLQVIDDWRDGFGYPDTADDVMFFLYKDKDDFFKIKSRSEMFDLIFHKNDFESVVKPIIRSDLVMNEMVDSGKAFILISIGNYRLYVDSHCNGITLEDLDTSVNKLCRYLKDSTSLLGKAFEWSE